MKSRILSLEKLTDIANSMVDISEEFLSEYGIIVNADISRRNSYTVTVACRWKHDWHSEPVKSDSRLDFSYSVPVDVGRTIAVRAVLESLRCQSASLDWSFTRLPGGMAVEK